MKSSIESVTKRTGKSFRAAW